MEVYDQEENNYYTFDIVSVEEKIEEADYSKTCKEDESNFSNGQSSGVNGSCTNSDKLSYHTVQQNTLAQNVSIVENKSNAAMRCPSCGKIYRAKKKWYETHMKYCCKELNLPCEYCLFKTNNEKSLRCHIIFMHPEKKAAQDKSNQSLSCTFTCTICCSVYETEASMKHHMSYCEIQPTVQCSHCPYKTKTKASLRSHIYYRHRSNKTSMMSDKPKLVCPDCGKNVAHNSLSQHMKYCKNKVKLQCAFCSFKTKVKWYLSKHILTRHFDGGYFQKDDPCAQIACPQCNKKYKYQTSLSNHLTVCGKEPRLKCNLCSYKCSTEKYLEIHIAHRHLNDAFSSN